MSQLLAVGDVLISEVLIYSATHTQLAVLRRHHLVTALPGGVVSFVDVAAALSTAWATAYKALVENSTSFRGVRVRRIFPAGNDAWAISTADAGPGTAGNGALPLQTAGLITFAGPALGAKGEGRQYLPFPSVTDNLASGRPSPGYKLAATALGALIVADQDISVGGVVFGTIRHVNFNITTHATVRLNTVLRVGEWATQKRRGDYGRANRIPF